MRYIIADKSLSEDNGFSPSTHRTNGKDILLNEKEVMFCPSLKGETIEERVKNINGKVYSFTEVIQIINDGGWNK